MEKLAYDFYNRADVLTIARELLGKVLVTQFNGIATAGRIVETEAYAGENDRASHAYGGRRTARTEVMYGRPGTAYVYLCYGIHHLFNVVTNREEVPHAVLVRAIAPLQGIPDMLLRTGRAKPDHSLGRGPGNVSRALGITTRYTGWNLASREMFIAQDGFAPAAAEVAVTPRIGVNYAGEDALLPYRFILKDSPYVSGKKQVRS
ncbi:DNA-3-methyladenine glycosylase [Chitinophaga japonensis]|uniref:Putative 3-methyladenine DNA glycosylase n=1 Tax=Chitinophaga japonensis TaxID=104662 RepID=A0A562SYX7_CHIJA|nr:DNA-3-methyladenine glycosylase [Chitinophaga japonensis]TWI86482.1 DNA-3-methyladenine glycosylase [Chitinophaga japonensis]